MAKSNLTKRTATIKFDDGSTLYARYVWNGDQPRFIELYFESPLEPYNGVPVAGMLLNLTSMLPTISTSPIFSSMFNALKREVHKEAR